MKSFEDIDFSGLERFGISEKEKRLVRARSKLSYTDIQSSVNNFCDDCRNPRTTSTMKAPLGVFLNSCFRNEVWKKPKPMAQYETIDDYEKRIREKRWAEKRLLRDRIKKSSESRTWYDSLSNSLQNLVTRQAKRGGVPVGLMSFFIYNAFILNKKTFQESLKMLLGEIDFDDDLKDAFRSK